MGTALLPQSGTPADHPHWGRSAITTAPSVTPTTSSRIRALARFDVFTYALAHQVVTSEREFIDSTVSSPNNDHRYAGIPTSGWRRGLIPFTQIKNAVSRPQACCRQPRSVARCSLRKICPVRGRDGSLEIHTFEAGSPVAIGDGLPTR